MDWFDIERREVLENGWRRTLVNLDKEKFKLLQQKTKVILNASRSLETPFVPYEKSEALKEIFLPEKDFDQILSLLKYKKNIILQGPPGVGKTFVAKQLAYSLIGAKEESRVQTIQFHQSYTYEDFIQGIRVDSHGQFVKKGGIFYRFCKKASLDSQNTYCLIIDEINRGNLSKIFGEALMLIESDKRGQEIILSNSEEDETFTVPENIYLIGTMNTADRSLAMVDYALRRRFCFVDIRPAFESEESREKFSNFLKKQEVPSDVIQQILQKMQQINAQIKEDTKNLGVGYQLGHSYFCVKSESYDQNWFQCIVDYELAPLLKEYWFDNLDKSGQCIKALRG